MKPIHNLGASGNVQGFFSCWMVTDILAGLLYRQRIDLTAELVKTGENVSDISQVTIKPTVYEALAQDASSGAFYLANSYFDETAAGAGQAQTQTQSRRLA